MEKLVVGTQNPGKVREYQRLLAGITDMEIVGLADLGIGDMDVPETGGTYEENATIKARAYARAAGHIALADDSGLEVDVLDGAPGLYSARYGQPGLDDAGRRAYLLANLQGVPDAQRTARFVCVIAVHDPARDITCTVRGECRGRILQADQDGTTGFGYDAIFLPEGASQSFARFTEAEKDRISHRGRAAAQLPLALDKLRRG